MDEWQNCGYVDMIETIHCVRFTFFLVEQRFESTHQITQRIGAPSLH
jgi:hypothetical protein